MFKVVNEDMGGTTCDIKVKKEEQQDIKVEESA